MTDQRDSSNLIAFVAMLLAAVGFKDTLQSIYLYGTDINLLHILGVAALLFGGILYFQLLNESYLSLQSDLAANPKQPTSLVIKTIYFTALVLLLAGPLIIMIVNGIADIFAAFDQAKLNKSEVIYGAAWVVSSIIIAALTAYKGVRIKRNRHDINQKLRDELEGSDSTEEMALVTNLYVAKTNKAYALRWGANQQYADEIAAIEHRLSQLRKSKKRNSAKQSKK